MYPLQTVKAVVRAKKGFWAILNPSDLSIVIATISFGAALLSVNITGLIITHGLIGGLGLGLAYTPANIVCTFHFEKKQAIAIALANSGSGIGIVAITFFLNIINAKYGWNGSVLFCTFIAPLTTFLALVVWIFPVENNDSDLCKTESHDNKNISMVCFTP